MWYRTHESELESGFYHADNARAHASYILCPTTRKCTQRSCIVIVYETYRLPNIWLTLMLIDLRMRFEQITLVRNTIAPLGPQG